MIRIILDELGDGHDDIILKIDAMPTFAQIGDLYYMADFLQLDPEKIDKVPGDLGIGYIEYVENKLEDLNDHESFVLFNIHDEYIEGLLISKGINGLLKVNYGTTDKIQGYEINKDVIDQLIHDRKPMFERQGEWLLDKKSILQGLDWSKEKIKNNS